MSDTENRTPVKILYLVPEGEEDAGDAESLWAYPLGNHLYELQNIPVAAAHLNVEDIVRCEEPAGSVPIITEVVKRSGNRTLRVIFKEETPDDVCVDIIWALTQRGILYERPVFKHYMFNIAPDDDYAWARDFLHAKEDEGLLWLYEKPIDSST